MLEDKNMRRVKALIIMLAFLVGLAAPVKSLIAAEASIAVVDVQLLLTESKPAKNIHEQVQKERDKLQAEFSGYETKLRESEKLLVEQRDGMTPEEFAKKRDQFQSSLQETGGLVQKKKRTLENAMVKATGKLRNEILKIVAGMAESNKYDIVLTRQNIVLVAKSYDITDQVMAAVNEKVGQIPLEMK